jgi:hypothetical protein
MSQFKILSQGEVVADILYLGPTANPVLMLDLTFDELDMEIHDIFYFMSKKAGILPGAQQLSCTGKMAWWMDRGRPRDPGESEDCAFPLQRERGHPTT